MDWTQRGERANRDRYQQPTWCLEPWNTTARLWREASPLGPVALLNPTTSTRQEGCYSHYFLSHLGGIITHSRAQVGLTVTMSLKEKEPSQNLLCSPTPLPAGFEPHRAIMPRSMTEEQRSRGQQVTFSVARSHSSWVTAGFNSSFRTNSQS